jgi:hypothetical protein
MKSFKQYITEEMPPRGRLGILAKMGNAITDKPTIPSGIGDGIGGVIGIRDPNSGGVSMDDAIKWLEDGAWTDEQFLKYIFGVFDAGDEYVFVDNPTEGPDDDDDEGPDDDDDGSPVGEWIGPDGKIYMGNAPPPGSTLKVLY